MTLTTFAKPIALAAAACVAAGCASTTATQPVAAQAGTRPQSPSPQQSLQKLMEGNARYVKGEHKQETMTPEKRAELAQGQSPYAIIVGCSDSRVPPELAFDAGPGDLFVIRDAGNIVDDNELATIEYGVAVLKSPLLMVLGHESCGAVDAAVKSEKGEADFDGHIHDLVEDIRPSVVNAMEETDATGDELLDAAVKANVRRVVDELERSKPYVGKAVEEGRLMIVPARYDLDTGEVTIIEMDAGAHDDHGHEDHDHGN